ncbi:MAG: AraC family transcriptional regulator [Verrucomicrobia bacterium]|nr:AraC family transcriptional regulator [Verrucomicrobiota bacterium]
MFFMELVVAGPRAARFAPLPKKCRYSCHGYLSCRAVAPTRERATDAGLDTPVQRLILVDEIERTQTVRFQSQSLPGHLLHIVTAGTVSQWSEGRAEAFGPNAVVWYHENEPVRGEILRAPWRFITINFHAPTLPPPPDDRRVLRADATTLRLGRRLLSLWRNHSMPPLERQFHCHRVLLELLHHLLSRDNLKMAPQLGAKLWWRIEKQLRSRLEEPITLADVQRLSGSSARSVACACKAATGLSPMKRLREIRLGYARGLVQHTDLPITEIAYRVGYARPQEFSRDYHRRFDVTPRGDREREPVYRQLEQPSPS